MSGTNGSYLLSHISKSLVLPSEPNLNESRVKFFLLCGTRNIRDSLRDSESFRVNDG